PRVSGLSILDDINSLVRQVYGRDGRECGSSDTTLAADASSGTALTGVERWEGAAEEPRDGDTCRGGGRYYLSFTWRKTSEKLPQRLPFEVIVGLESAVTDPGPARTETVTAMAEPAGHEVPVIGGGSFTTAAELPGSGRYTALLQRGEIVYYRVRLDWGPGLAHRVRFEGVGDRDTVNIRTGLFAPTAEEIEMDTAAYRGSEKVLPTSAEAIATVPIRYDNRNGFDQREQALPGWYYLAVKVGPGSGLRKGAPVPVTVELTVAGEPEPGPVYADAAEGGVFGESGGA